MPRTAVARIPFSTVAYVTENAQDNATYLVLVCTHILMHPRAKLGDFERFLAANPKTPAPSASASTERAQEGHYPTLLAKGMVDRELTIYRCAGPRYARSAAS